MAAVVVENAKNVAGKGHFENMIHAAILTMEGRLGNDSGLQLDKSEFEGSV